MSSPSNRLATLPGRRRSTKPEVVVITGASAGLGRAIARAFADEHAHVALMARGIEGLEATRQEVEERGGQAAVFPLDVADDVQVEAAAAAVESRFGPIDIWINNAMVSVFSPVKEMTAAEYKRVTEVTYLGYVHGTLAALRRMLPRDRGLIIQVGSALAYRGIPLQSAYCAAKHAIKGFCDSLRCELLHDKSNVKLVMVQMPAMNTPQFSWVKSRLPNSPQPVPPIYQPEIGAQAVLFVARHPRREMYVGYPTFEAIIGNKLFPGFVDRYLARQGYEAQQTQEPVQPDRSDNLWHPIPGDHGPHGAFTARSARTSPLLWLSTHGRSLGLALATVAVFGLLRTTRARPRVLSPEV
jgi:NAD(P)-dependent dehydrogenase (short-subunit alcohol dehydrogenase family)